MSHPEISAIKKPQLLPGLVRTESISFDSVAAAAALNRNDQTQEKHKQIDVGEIHPQSACQVLIVSVGARHRVEIDESGADERRADLGQRRF